MLQILFSTFKSPVSWSRGGKWCHLLFGFLGNRGGVGRAALRGLEGAGALQQRLLALGLQRRGDAAGRVPRPGSSIALAGQG